MLLWKLSRWNARASLKGFMLSGAEPARRRRRHPISVQFVAFLRWLPCRMRDDQIIRVLVRGMALTHLLHTYKMLR